MKKKLLIIGGVVLGLGVAFTLGTKTGATTDWQTNVVNQANSELGAAAYNKKSELIEGADADIQETMIDELSIEERQAELQRLLDEYYKLKLQGMTDSQAFKDLETQINSIQQSILSRYKTEIDNVFSSKQ